MFNIIVSEFQRTIRKLRDVGGSECEVGSHKARFISKFFSSFFRLSLVDCQVWSRTTMKNRDPAAPRCGETWIEKQSKALIKESVFAKSGLCSVARIGLAISKLDLSS